MVVWPRQIRCCTTFCKRLPSYTGQEQACTRITWLVGCSIVCHHAENGWIHRQLAVDSAQYSPVHHSSVYYSLDSAAVSIFVVILVELTNTDLSVCHLSVFVNSTNITTNIETAVLSTTAHQSPIHPSKDQYSPVKPTTAHHSPEQPSTVQCSPVEPTTAQNSPVHPSSAQYIQVQPSTARYSTLQPSTAQ